MDTRLKSHRLPALAFGQRIARTLHSIGEFESRMANATGWIPTYEPIGDPERFINTSAMVDINGFRLTAVAHSPMRLDVESPNSSMIVFPVAGENQASVANGYRVSFEPGKRAAFAPEGRRTGVAGYRSAVVMDFDKQRLLRTAGTMFGGVDERVSGMDLSVPRELSLKSGNFSWDAGFRGRPCTSSSPPSRPPLW